MGNIKEPAMTGGNSDYHKGFGICCERAANREEIGFFKTDLRAHHEGIINDRLLFLPSFREATSTVINGYLNREEVESVLEIGCGTGFFSRYLAEPWLKKRLTSLDISSLSYKH
jgi:hypothetical protein